MDEERVMVPARRAAAIADVSPQRLWYWEKTALVAPSIRRDLSPRNIVRLYSLDRLLELVVCAAIVRHPGISLQHLRQVLDYLQRFGEYDSPLRELKFAIQGREVFFQHPDGSWEGSRKPHQLVAKQILDLTAIREHIDRSLTRGPDEQGSIVRQRKVRGSKPVFAGTRVPVSAVEAFISEGASDDEILEAFPILHERDVKAARARQRATAS